jgi:hypothetical protein
MGLTKLRAEQISDIDYKQAVRVITISNVTLSGGAPSQVDGVNLSVGDRILVNGQTTGSQNGIYQVETVGTGSNGTWIRTTDTNATGELEAGTIVMVTEGTVYADSQWKLTTNNPIIIGTTALTFEQNSAFAFGNIYANGTAVLANSVGSTVTFTAGNNIAITGNNTSKTVAIAVTGISLNSISNGTSNVNVVSSGGNVTVGIGGTANVAVFATTGLTVAGIISATGNITSGNVSTAGLITATGNVQAGNLRTAGLISATSTITSAANIIGGNITTAGLVTATGNVTGGNINTAGLVSVTGNVQAGNLRTAGLISATGNITGNFFIGNGSQLTGINAFSNITVSGGNSIVADSISDTLTITAGAGISIVADASTDTLTIATSSGSDIFVDGADFGTVTEPVTASDDLGLVTEAVTAESDLGTLVISGLIYPDQFVLPVYTVGTLPSATPAAQMIYVSNETGGAVPAFSDGTNWRRVTDRAIVS